MNRVVHRQLNALAMAGILLAAASAGQAAELYVYPAQGQDADQQGRDEYECYAYAKQNTGFDPMARAGTSSGAPSSGSGSAVGGAAKGALVTGLATRAVTGSSKDAKKAARGGAVVGGIVGGSKRNSNERAQQQRAEEEMASYDRQRDNYNRAYSACLEGRGYTVR